MEFRIGVESNAIKLGSFSSFLFLSSLERQSGSWKFEASFINLVSLDGSAKFIPNSLSLNLVRRMRFGAPFGEASE